MVKSEFSVQLLPKLNKQVFGPEKTFLMHYSIEQDEVFNFELPE